MCIILAVLGSPSRRVVAQFYWHFSGTRRPKRDDTPMEKQRSCFLCAYTELRFLCFVTITQIAHTAGKGFSLAKQSGPATEFLVRCLVQCSATTVL